MTAPVTTRSAYPATVEDLLPRAQRLAASLDRPLSRNLLMKEFRIGSPKATAVLEALAAAPVSAPPVADLPDPPPGTVAVAPDHDEPIDGPDVTTTPAPAPNPLAQYGGPPVPSHPIVTAPEPAVWQPFNPQPDPESFAAPFDTGESPQDAPDPGHRRPVTWPVLILCLPAFVAIWGGWVEMGRLTGFGVVKLLPGIADSVELNTAITLPIGVETYAAYALYVWLSGRATGDARAFAKWSALASLGLGAAGQVAYHLMAAWGWTSAPWPITAAVSCIPVAVLGMGAALAHLMHTNH